MTGCRSSRSPGCLGIRNLGRSLTPIKGGPEQHPGERDKISLLLGYERGFVFAERVDHRVTLGDDDLRWQRSTDLQPVSHKPDSCVRDADLDGAVHRGWPAGTVPRR